MYDAHRTLTPSEFARYCELFDGHKPATMAEYGAVPPLRFCVCGSCSREYRAYRPIPGRPVKAAACSACGCRHFVSDVASRQTPLSVATLSAAAIFTTVFRGTEDNRRVLARALGIDYGVERRREARASVLAPVTCAALDDSLQPVSLAFEGMLLNVSRHGAQFVTPDATPAQAMLIDFTDAGCPEIQVIGKVRWQRPERANVVSVGCEFVNHAGEPLPIAGDEKK